MVRGVREEQVALAIEREAEWIDIRRVPGSGDGSDGAVRIDPPYSGVAGNIDVALTVERDARRADGCLCRRTAITSKSVRAGSGDGRDDPRRIDAPDATVQGVNNIEVAVAVRHDVKRI